MAQTRIVGSPAVDQGMRHADFTPRGGTMINSGRGMIIRSGGVFMHRGRVPPPAVLAAAAVSDGGSVTPLGSTPAEGTAATAANYALVLVPIQTRLTVFTVVGTFVEAETGAVARVAVLLITIMAMRSAQWNQLMAKAAAHLQPPKN
jgi:hypothetical protein